MSLSYSNSQQSLRERIQENHNAKQQNLFKQQILVIKLQKLNKKLSKSNNQLKNLSCAQIACGVGLVGTGITTTILSGGILGPFWISIGCFHFGYGSWSFRRHRKNLKKTQQKLLELENKRQIIVNKLLQ